MKMAIMLMMAIITIPTIILIIAFFFLIIIFRHLADELAGMLDRLEIEEERSAAVNAAVLGEQEEVEEALKVGNISILYHSKSCQAFSFNLIIHS